MAPDPHRHSVEEDTVALAAPEGPETDEVTREGDQWPVADLYRVEPDEQPVPEDSGSEAVGPPGVPATEPPQRTLMRSFDRGLLLAAIAVAAVLAAVAAVLLLGEDEPAASSTQPTLSTEPPPDTSTVPSQDATVVVASVEGMTVAEARQALERQGLRVRVTRSPSERQRGEVVSQAPGAGSEVAKDTVIALVVSGGANAAMKRVEVPDVTGLSASKAVATLRDAGLDARVRLVSSSERAGVVVGQSPSGSAEVPTDALVQLEVAKARPTVERVEVPDVVGMTAAAARRELRAAGLSVATISAQSQEAAGTVVKQSPRAGAELRKDGRVTLTVSSGPAKIDVPDVTGLDEASATAELERAGFQVRVTDESTTDPTQDGTVLRQTPPGGSSATEGAIVTITVARTD